jgi:ankyrin repeat protein
VGSPNTNDLKLWRAARAGQLARVEFLINQGANLEFRCGENDTTVLHQAAKYLHKAVLEALLKAGADPDGKDKEGVCALHFASLENIALPLIAAGVDIDDEHHVGNTPENLAQKRQSMEVVEALIKGRADRRKIYRVVEDVNSSRSPPLLEIKLVIVIASTLYMYLRFSIAYDHIAVISYSRQHHTPYCSRRSRSPFFFWMAHRHIENRP